MMNALNERAPMREHRGAEQSNGRSALHVDHTTLVASIGAVARELLGEPNASLSSARELRFGAHGSLSVDLDKGTFYDHEAVEGGGVLALVTRQTGREDARAWMVEHGHLSGEVPRSASPEAIYSYADEHGEILFQVERKAGHKFLQRKPDGMGGWAYGIKGVRQVSYRLPELLARPDETVFVCEGEKDADNLHAVGLLATCNSGGAGKWRADHSQHLRGRDVVILPDNDAPGRDHARKVAQSLEGIARSVRIVEIPGLPNKGDVSDWLAAGGTAGELLAMARTAPVQAELEAEPAHPLAKVLPMGGTPAAPNWILPGAVEAGVITFAGARGVGKTTAAFPLACAAAGIHEPGYSLAPHPERWRHVIYVSEHPAQVQRIAAGLAHHLGITVEEIGQRVHLVEAVRMAASYLVEVGQHYREQFTRRVDGVELLPLVVLDTQAASLALENENDNAQASAAVAALKQRFEGLPVWIVCHIAKGDLNRRNAHELTARGAGAIEADAVGCLYLVKDGEGHDAARWLILGKHRFEATRHEWRLDSGSLEVQARNAWGEIEPTRVRWAIARPDKPRAVAVAEAKDAARAAEADSLRRCITAMVAQAWRDGEPLNRAALKRKLGGRAQTVADAIADLVDDGELYEVPIPPKLRTNANRQSFLIRLTEEERDHLKATGEPPQVEIPPSWRKADSGTDGNEHAEPERANDPIPSVPIPSVPLREITRERTDGASETPPSCSDFLNEGTNGNEREQTGTNGPGDAELVAEICARMGIAS